MESRDSSVGKVLLDKHVGVSSDVHTHLKSHAPRWGSAGLASHPSTLEAEACRSLFHLGQQKADCLNMIRSERKLSSVGLSVTPVPGKVAGWDAETGGSLEYPLWSASSGYAPVSAPVHVSELGRKAAEEGSHT